MYIQKSTLLSILLLVILAFSLGCNFVYIEKALATPTPEEARLTLMRMITIKDVTILTYSLHEEGNVGGTISKGTVILVQCDDLICQFPGTHLYIPRSSVEPYILIDPFEPEGSRLRGI